MISCIAIYANGSKDFIAERILRQNMQIFIAQKRCEIAVSKIRFRNNADGYAFPHARDSEKKNSYFRSIGANSYVTEMLHFQTRKLRKF